jgi:NADH-quinone oxidoreductase subunit G
MRSRFPPRWSAASGAGDKILVSADRNPNVRGALITGLISALPAQQLTSLATDIDAGKVKTVLSVGEDLTAAGLTAAQLAKVAIVYLGTHDNATQRRREGRDPDAHRLREDRHAS